MSHRFPLLALLALTFGVLASGAAAQEAEEPRRVILTDGTVFVGTVEDENADPVVVVTTDGLRREFARERVAEILPLIEGRFFRTDPVRSRVLFAPSARTMGAGETRVDLAGYLPSVTVGLGDRVDFLATGFLSFSDGGGFSPLLGIKGQVVDTEDFQLALGASAIIGIGGGESGVAAVPYAVATVGNDVGSLSFGAGGFVGSSSSLEGVEVADGFVLGIGGERQLNNGVKLFVETLTLVGLDGSGTVGTAIFPGVRLFGDNFAFDIIGFVVTDYGSLYGFAPVPARLSYTF